MKIRNRLLLVVLTLGVATAAHAGLYVRASALYIKPDSWNSSGIKASFDQNLGYSGAIGYKLTSLRVEGEFVAARNSFDSSTFGATTTTTGSLSHNVAMLNAYMDIFKFLMVEPYIGVGVGYMEVKADNLSFTAGPTYDSSDSVIAYQAMAGVNVALTGHLRLGAGLRYITSDKSSFNSTTGGPTLSDRFKGTMFEISTRYDF